MSTTYRLRVTNNSNAFEQFAVYQNDLAHLTAVHVDGDREHQRYNWGVYLDAEVIRWVSTAVNG